MYSNCITVLVSPVNRSLWTRVNNLVAITFDGYFTIHPINICLKLPGFNVMIFLLRCLVNLVFNTSNSGQWLLTWPLLTSWLIHTDSREFIHLHLFICNQIPLEDVCVLHCSQTNRLCRHHPEWFSYTNKQRQSLHKPDKNVQTISMSVWVQVYTR